MADLIDEVSGLKREIVALKGKVDETREIVQAWEAAKATGKFVKWLAGLGSGLAGLWIIAKAAGASFLK